MISQNEYPDSICSGRVNQYVPFGHKRLAFSACFHRPPGRLAQRHAFGIDVAAARDNRRPPCPRHPLGPLQPRLHRAPLGALPRPCPPPPTALPRLVRAGRGRVIEQRERLAAGIAPRHEAREPWRPPTAAGRAVRPCARYSLKRALLLGPAPLPPRRPRSAAASARLGGTAAGHLPWRRVGVDAPPRALCFLAPQGLSPGLVSAAGVPPTRDRAHLDRGLPVQTPALDRLRVLSRGGFLFECPRGPRLPCSLAAAWR